MDVDGLVRAAASASRPARSRSSAASSRARRRSRRRSSARSPTRSSTTRRPRSGARSAVQSRRCLTPEQAADLGTLDPEAIARVRARGLAASRAMPTSCTTRSCCSASRRRPRARRGAPLFERLRADRPRDRRRSAERRRRVGQRRAAAGSCARVAGCRRGRGARRARRRGPRRSPTVRCASSCAAASKRSGPVTAETLARPFGLHGRRRRCRRSSALEQQGVAMRGHFTAAAPAARSGASGACWRASIATR